MKAKSYTALSEEVDITRHEAPDCTPYKWAKHQDSERKSWWNRYSPNNCETHPMVSWLRHSAVCKVSKRQMHLPKCKDFSRWKSPLQKTGLIKRIKFPLCVILALLYQRLPNVSGTGRLATLSLIHLPPNLFLLVFFISVNDNILHLLIVTYLN